MQIKTEKEIIKEEEMPELPTRGRSWTAGDARPEGNHAYWVFRPCSDIPVPCLPRG